MNNLRYYIKNKFPKSFAIRMRGWCQPNEYIHTILVTSDGEHATREYYYDELKRILDKYGDDLVWRIDETDDDICYVLDASVLDYEGMETEGNFVENEFPTEVSLGKGAFER